MSQPYRLPKSGRIDRKQAIEFSFDGKTYQGYRGDTLASALLANGVNLIGRSFKYHRPRGILGAGAEDPNAIVQIGRGARTIPNVRATQCELYEGLQAFSVNAWPSLKFDLRAVNSAFGKLMPAGFYYKTFMWPSRLWMTYEHHIRQAAGFGSAPELPDPDHYDKMNAHCDVLIAGSGPAGLAAALAASRSGARVILADEQSELGGSLLSQPDQTIDGEAAADWLARCVRELAQSPDVTLLPRSTAFGYYDHNFVALCERCNDHLPTALAQGPRQRIWRVRAKRVILATGSIERPLVFGNNDRPGVMLASAVSAYVNRYAVKPGRRAVVFCNNDSAYRTALDLQGAGVEVAALIDSRHGADGHWQEQIRARGIPLRTGHVVIDIQGSQRMDGARVMALSPDGRSVSGSIDGIACDLVAVSGGWSPAVHLHSQAGGKNTWDEAQACFVPGSTYQHNRSVGAANGVFDLAGCLREGYKAGAEAALTLGLSGSPGWNPVLDEPAEQPLQPLWRVPQAQKHGPRQFVDFQNDTSASDILLAVREGYHSVEHVKRYTALGFGTDQGKLGNINGMAILAEALNQSIPQTGTTTFRPAYTPTTFGALAGRELGDELFDPVRKMAMHGWHEEHGAEFEDVGQWKRPWYYPKTGESLHDAVRRECLAVRQSVGVLDASTLGKIDIQGPDAAELLNWVYTNGWSKLAVGRCRYGLMLKEDGMVFDDGVTTRLGENHYLMTTTTGGVATVLNWLERWLQTEWPQLKVYLTSVTDHWATVSLAGPNARKVLQKLCADIDFDAFPFMSYQEGTVAGVKARVMRISFTGELSYEINIPANYGHYIWDAVMDAGAEFNITPYGTETMHVLRAEKGYIIVGQETDGSVTPVDLGMGSMLGKKEFLGKRSLQRSDTTRTDRKQLVGLLSKDPQKVLQEGGQIIENPNTHEQPVPMLGHVTSSYYSPILDKAIALALVKNGHQRNGETLYVADTRGGLTPVEVTKPVFYDPEGARLNG